MSRKRTLSILTASILIVATILSGCGNASPTSSTSATPEASASSAVSSETEPAVKELEPVTLSVFIDHTWFWVDTFAGPIAEEITKRTGVTLEITKAADANQLPVRIASGDYEELIYTSRLADVLSDPLISYDWNSLIEQYAPSFQVDPIEIGNNTMADGKFYTLKNAYSPPADWKDIRVLPSPGTPNIGIRSDILEKLGNPPIKTVDDFVKVLGMVKEQFPNMTPHIINLSEGYDRYWWATFGVPAGNAGVYVNDDKVQYFVRSPQFVEAARFMSSMVQNGYMTVESLIYKSEQYTQEVSSGKAFSFARASTDPAGVTQDLEKNGVTDAKFVPLENVLGDKAVLINDGIGWSGTYITKNCKAPDRAIQFLEYMKSEEGQRLSTWGIEGVHYNLVDGYPERTEAGAEAMTGEGYQNISIGVWTFGMSAKTEGLWNYDPNRPQITNALLAWKNVIQFKPEYYFLRPKSDSDQGGTYTKINDLITKEKVKLYSAKNNEEFDNAYAEMIKTAENMGLEALESWMTDLYIKDIKPRYAGN